MMRVGKRALQEKRLFATARAVAPARAATRRVTFQPCDGLLLHEPGGIEVFRRVGLVDLRGAHPADGPRARRPGPRFQRGRLAPEPFRIMPGDQVPVAEAERDVLETVVRCIHARRPLRWSAFQRHFDHVFVLAMAAAHGLRQFRRRREQTVGEFLAGRLGGLRRHSLQMTLTDERRAVSRRQEQVDKGDGIEIQRDAVIAHPVYAGDAPGHERRPVAHAGRRRHVKPGQPGSPAGDPVDIRRPEHRVAGVTDMIPTLLVGEEEKEIGPCGVGSGRHGSPRPGVAGARHRHAPPASGILPRSPQYCRNARRTDSVWAFIISAA